MMGANRFNLPHKGLSFFALLLAVTVGRVLHSECMRRLFRNAALPGIPDAVQPAYPACSDDELVESVSLVVTVKDTCAQAEGLLSHLAGMFPRGMHVYYAYPAVRGCRHVPAGEIGRRLFQNFTELAVGEADAPIAGFLKAQPLIKTKYAVLMHNDAYPMERDFACEMYRALEAHPHYPIAAPQIYEVAADGIIVPHGHHQHLHTRPSSTGPGDRIDYDLSMKLLTMRKPEDFKEGPQVDFLEDHAFFARVDAYHELLDPAGSFTLEYMDMILNMRARNTSAWYVPTARCVFDVDTRKITWEDLPYLVYKRSEQIGHQVRTYLTNKWGVEFVNTGIWNYVRYVMLADVVIEKDDLPTSWEDQASVFYSWFESVGFNRYNGEYLPQFIENPTAEPVTVSRTQKQTLPTEVPEHRVPPQSASEVLPRVQRKKLGIDISFKEPHLSIALKKSSCNATEPESYQLCGLAVQEGDSCTCFNYVVPFNLRTTLYLDSLMAIMKLPARAFMYGQMKYWTVSINPDSVDVYCEPTQEDCSMEVHFSRDAKVLQWSWFGKQPKYAFTPEGVAIGSALALFVLAMLFFAFGDPKAIFGQFKCQELRKFWALNKAICTQAMRS
mmetsp:Transcript_25670/g.59824  ORF Transcript_25670/g.59824 Transcript_25670/m.59824 type:complete len:612 (-) Transcript_25670:85-1920(-)|eukprot:CAMPEP_0178423876 /NCGR_PEP_ID=MMETSP0689_2-20121128/27914_1 /TAXON_ID=160604 /ORGANISM="Amphidinium massartii, Strain CS-259" /LENGTH=611 /DNA_ID=CAMNT_0020045483 /DNA_START=134 /DNA_END=1969 /DNA_ORIENTATION=+